MQRGVERRWSLAPEAAGRASRASSAPACLFGFHKQWLLLIPSAGGPCRVGCDKYLDAGHLLKSACKREGLAVAHESSRAQRQFHLLLDRVYLAAPALPHRRALSAPPIGSDFPARTLRSTHTGVSGRAVPSRFPQEGRAWQSTSTVSEWPAGKAQRASPRPRSNAQPHR